MKNTFKVGDKVFYKTVICGLIKARVVKINERTDWRGNSTFYPVLKVTSRTNKIFYCGYVFEASPTFTFHR